MMTAIELYDRPSPGFDARVAHAAAVLESAATEHAGRIVQATSLGAEDMVLTDLIARHQLPIAIATLDTGMLHSETLALIPRIEQPMYQSIELRKSCCELRKLQPLARMLNERSAWVTGLRREQSAHRGAVPFSELDAQGRIKFNPLADWSWNDVWHYISAHDVPYNDLHDQFYPSVGCAPCTRAIAVGEDFRAGRWWWEAEDAKECGLHVKAQEVAA